MYSYCGNLEKFGVKWQVSGSKMEVFLCIRTREKVVKWE